MYIIAHPSSFVEFNLIDAAISQAKVEIKNHPRPVTIYELRAIKTYFPEEPIPLKKA
jgi:hypothetical protein